MRALRFSSFGDPAEVTDLVTTDSPGAPGPGQVAVAVEAAPINPSDLLQIRGLYGVRPPLPAGMGSEGAGTVVAVGAGVDSVSAGDRVMLIPSLHTGGTWADRVVVGADGVLPLPAGISIEQAAMAGVNPITAKLLLDAAGPPAAGQWIGQTAANSAVGVYVVQLARLAGIRTLNVVRRPEAAGPLRELGADAVVIAGDTLSADIRAALGEDQLRAVFDAVAGPATLALSRSVHTGGSLISYGAVGADPVMVLPRDLIFRGVSVHGFWLVTWLRQTDNATVRAAYEQVIGLIADGSLNAPVEASYELSRYREAFAHAQRPARAGKVLLAMNGR